MVKLSEDYEKIGPPYGTRFSKNGHHSEGQSPTPEERKAEAGDGAPSEGSQGGNTFNDLIVSMTPPVLGEAAYHGFIGDFLRVAGPQTEATDACIIAHLIPAMGTVIGPDLHVWGGDKQPTRFNTAIVGHSSTGRKGTGYVPVRDVMMKADPKFWKDQPAKGLSSGEGLIVRVADKLTEDKQPIFTEKRLYVVEPEFSKVLANIRRESNILSCIMREAFDSGHLATMTVNPREAFGAHISITAHITPEELKKRMSDIDIANGFANRFLWFYVKSDKKLPNAEPIPDKQLGEFANRLTVAIRSANQLTNKVGQVLKSSVDTRVQMDSEAAEVWRVEYDKLCCEWPGMVGVLMARGSCHVLRLALLYALLDLEKGKEAKPDDLIRLPHLRAALAVWDYSVASIHLLFKKETGNSLADKLYKLLAGGPMLTSEFYAHLGSKGHDIHEALEQLERNELVVSEKIMTGKRGQPPTKWRRVELPETIK